MFKSIFFGHRVPGSEPVPGGSGTGSGSSTLATAGYGSMKNDRVPGYAHP